MEPTPIRNGVPNVQITEGARRVLDAKGNGDGEVTVDELNAGLSEDLVTFAASGQVVPKIGLGLDPAADPPAANRQTPPAAPPAKAPAANAHPSKAQPSKPQLTPAQMRNLIAAMQAPPIEGGKEPPPLPSHPTAGKDKTPILWQVIDTF